MTEPLATINFQWRPYGMTFYPGTVRYVGPWVYIIENLGVARVNAMTGLAQFAPIARIRNSYPGRFSTGQDAYQAIRVFDVNDKWLVTDGTTGRGWHDSAGVPMQSLQVWRVDSTEPRYIGQLPPWDDPAPPILVGDTCYVREPFPDDWAHLKYKMVDLAAMTVGALVTTTPTPTRQPNIEGCTYIYSSAGFDSDGTKLNTLTRQGVWTGTPEPPPPVVEPPPPTTEPPPPTTEPPPVPATSDVIALLTRIAVATEKIAAK